MLGDRRWRKNLIVGVLLVTAGAVGLWAIGFWTPELIRDVIADSATPDQYRCATWSNSEAPGQSRLVCHGAAGRRVHSSG